MIADLPWTACLQPDGCDLPTVERAVEWITPHVLDFISQPFGALGALGIVSAFTFINSRFVNRRLHDRPWLIRRGFNGLNLAGATALLVHAFDRTEVVWVVLETYMIGVGLRALWHGRAPAPTPRPGSIIEVGSGLGTAIIAVPATSVTTTGAAARQPAPDDPLRRGLQHLVAYNDSLRLYLITGESTEPTTESAEPTADPFMDPIGPLIDEALDRARSAGHRRIVLIGHASGANAVMARLASLEVDQLATRTSETNRSEPDWGWVAINPLPLADIANGTTPGSNRHDPIGALLESLRLMETTGDVLTPTGAAASFGFPRSPGAVIIATDDRRIAATLRRYDVGPATLAAALRTIGISATTVDADHHLSTLHTERLAALLGSASGTQANLAKRTTPALSERSAAPRSVALSYFGSTVHDNPLLE